MLFLKYEGDMFLFAAISIATNNFVTTASFICVLFSGNLILDNNLLSYYIYNGGGKLFELFKI